MTKHDGPSGGPDRETLVRNIADAFAPPELTQARRASIDAGVWARVERRSRFTPWLVAAATAATAAIVVVLVSGPHVESPAIEESSVADSRQTGGAPAVPQVVAALPQTTDTRASDAAWARALLLAPGMDAGSGDRLDELPAEYRAITDMLLEG